MKQRKSLDLNSKVMLEAIFGNEGNLEVNFRVGKKDYRIANEEVEQLRNWLSNEVLRDGHSTLIPNRVGQEISQVYPKGPTASGPLILVPGTQQAVPNDLDARRAVVSSGGVVDLSRSASLINKRDELQVQNLSGSIGKAKEAFSPQHINDGGQGS